MKFAEADWRAGASLELVCVLWAAVVTADAMGAGRRPDRPLGCESSVVDMTNNDGMSVWSPLDGAGNPRRA
jgi:hypothetical protein